MQAEYAKAPQVTRDRMYLETMQQIYGNVTKVLVDSKQGSNMLYLPLDKIMQLSAQGEPGQQPAAQPATTETRPASSNNSASPRSRDSERSRDSR